MVDEQNVGEKKKDESKCKKRFQKEFSFFQRTSMHGYPFIAETKNSFRRFFWLMLSLAGLGALFYFMFQYFNEFLNEKPTITSSTKTFLKHAKLPSITICNSQILRKNVVEELENPMKILDYFNKLHKQETCQFADVQEEALSILLNCLNNTEENLPTDFFIKLSLFEFAVSACAGSTAEYVWNHEVSINYILRQLYPTQINFSSTITQETELHRCLEEKKNVEWVNDFSVHELQVAGSLFNTSCLNPLGKFVDMKEEVDTSNIYQIQKIQSLVFSLLNLYAIHYFGEKKIAPLMLTTNLKDAIIESSWNMKDFIISCTIGDIKCNLDDFQPVFTDSGVCYELRTNISQRSPGNFGGLQLMVNIESYNQYTQNIVVRGVNGLEIVIHHETEPAAESLRHIPLPTGTLSYVTIKNLTTLLLDEDKGGNCNESSKLDLYPHFTSFGCEYDCKFRTLEKLCNCMSLSDVRMQESRDYWRKGCYHFDETLCTMRNMETWRLKADCKKCQKPSCVLHNYAPKVMSAKLMNTSLEHFIITQEIECLKDHGVHFNIPFNFLTWKAPLDDIRNLSSVCLTRFNWNENIVQVNVFYDEISEIRVEQLPKYTITDFIGCVGGTMGIYTGMSLITVFEVLEYLYFRILHI
ncbi:hypothetical protein SNEBB_004785 [Seison nebaliae]|nr:hypothetical protein SNEBB_004785 [Seison nebaliae]